MKNRKMLLNINNIECIGCGEKLGERPNNLLLMHKAEGIQVYAICGKIDCWIFLGKKMAQGKR